MKLNDQQQVLKERGHAAQSFLESDFCQRFLFPYIEQERMTAYPEPKSPGWEDAYRLAYAKDTVYTTLFTVMKNWVSEAKQLEEYEQRETDFTTA